MLRSINAANGEACNTAVGPRSFEALCAIPTSLEEGE